MKIGTCCPTCGHALDDSLRGVSYDPESGVVVRDGYFVRLSKIENEIFGILWKVYPNLMHNERVHFQVWQGRDVDPNNVRVRLAQMRPKMKRLGIEFRGRDGSYGILIQPNFDVQEAVRHGPVWPPRFMPKLLKAG